MKGEVGVIGVDILDDRSTLLGFWEGRDCETKKLIGGVVIR